MPNQQPRGTIISQKSRLNRNCTFIYFNCDYFLIMCLFLTTFSTVPVPQLRCVLKIFMKKNDIHPLKNLLRGHRIWLNFDLYGVFTLKCIFRGRSIKDIQSAFRHCLQIRFLFSYTGPQGLILLFNKRLYEWLVFMGNCLFDIVFYNYFPVQNHPFALGLKHWMWAQ